MSDFLIKYFFIFSGCIYARQRLINKRFSDSPRTFLLLSAALALTACLLREYCPALTDLVPLLLLCLYFGVTTAQPKLAFVTTTIAFAITYCLSVTAVLVTAAILAPVHSLVATAWMKHIACLLSGILEVLILISLFRIKRFRKGMPFLSSAKVLEAGTLTSVCIFALLLYARLATTFPWSTRILSISVFLGSIVGIIGWWQSRLTRVYIEKLHQTELESLQKELDEKERKLKEIGDQNVQLGRLIHKDNKLIPAMENAVLEFLSSDAAPEAKERGRVLCQELKELSVNRRDILTEISSITSQGFHTGVVAVDAMLTYMDKRFQQQQMTFTVNIPEDLGKWVPDAISADDLSHLLSDLLENALIATKPCVNRQIRLQIHGHCGHLMVEVSDSGIPFQPASIIKFGLEQMTTHAATGGSGIGLMDIWKLKEKYRASIHITEYAQTVCYSKKIAFVADNKNEYLVRSWRHRDLAELNTRTDLLILPEESQDEQTIDQTDAQFS